MANLDQFYTPRAKAKLCLDFLFERIDCKNMLFVEPAAGTGAFYDQINYNKIGLDLDPRCEGVLKQNFLTYKFEHNNVITVGNPPFGKNSSLAVKFFNHAASSKYIAMIFPRTFEKASIQNRLNPYFHLHSSLPLDGVFINEGKNVIVPSVFQIWERRDYKRELVKTLIEHDDFQFVSKKDATFSFQRVGVNAGCIRTDFSDRAEQSHYFIKCSNEVFLKFKKLDFSDVKLKCAGNPSISKRELIFSYLAL